MCYLGNLTDYKLYLIAVLLSLCRVLIGVQLKTLPKARVTQGTLSKTF